MRRTLCLCTILAAALAVGCSRQPQSHVGEWDGKMTVTFNRNASRLPPLNIEVNAVFYFSKDGKVQKTGEDFITEKEKVDEGEYEIDYSKNPVQLKINWLIEGKNYNSPGIVRFIGEDKDRMQYCWNFPEDPTPPPSFDNAPRCWWLTKKVKK